MLLKLICPNLRYQRKHMYNIKINGTELSVPEDYTIYKAAHENSFEIPTLCYHKALLPYGACRVCLVEINNRGRKQLVASCTHPVSEGLEVETDTELVKETRSIIFELLLSRAGDIPAIKELAAKYGITGTALPSKNDDCIMCGLCVRVCGEIVGRDTTCFSSRGKDRKVATPYKQLSDVCIGCGACAFVCPTGAVDPQDYIDRQIEQIPNDFNCGLDSRTAVHLPFPQAVPNKPILDRDNCIYYQTGGCKTCESICQAKAISYDKEDEFVKEKVGAIVLATGYKLMDPKRYEEYGYGSYPDVVTSLEFERLVSSSGPTTGELVRPSDGKVPKTVVFIQCVGSRDSNIGVPYCSGICCMYTAKHTLLYKHKVPDGQAYVFYIDVRANGKNYEQFVRKVSDEKKALYLRGRVSKVYPMKESLMVKGADTLSGAQVEIQADMVVLATAVEAGDNADKLAQTFKVSYDEFNFLSEAHPKLRPVETNTAGIFLAGTCQGPKDIPETVAQASGAASKVLGIISHNELEREPTIGIVNESLCNGCFDCQRVCPFNAIETKEIKNRDGALIKLTANINTGLCQGCGTCSATCRSGCIEVEGFTDSQLVAQILSG
jgi:heterodisulfide reductase subunit A